MSIVHSIYRYPLKGFGGQSLQQAQLELGKGLACDRQFALSNGQSPINEDGQWTACQAFVRLTKNADLSLYKVQFEASNELLELQSPQGEILAIELNNPESFTRANATLERWFPSKPPAKTQLVQAASGYWDHVDAEISIINIDTVQALSHAAGLTIDPLRFRGNLYANGLPAQSELAWLGKRIRIGQAEFEITRPIDRCSATSLDLLTAQIDVNMPALLARHMGHIFCGVYARVVKPGLIRPGDYIELIGAALNFDKLYSHPSTAPAPEQWPRFAAVVRREKEDQYVDSFWLQDPLASQRAPVLAGQHIRVHLQEGEKSFWRAYTVSGVEGDLLRISVKRAAASQGGSQWLHENAKVGGALLMSGAYGEFTAPQQPKSPIVLVSAGIGITPMVAMLKDLVAQQTAAPIKVLNACNSASDLALWHEIQTLAAQLPNVTTRLFFKEATSVQCQQFQASQGQMQFNDVPKADILDTSVYMCGPNAFMQFAQTQLQSLGIQSHQIHREVFATPQATAGITRTAPVQKPFQVTFMRQNLTVTWQPQSGSLLDLAEQHGLKPRANCRSGACNTCWQTVAEGQVFHMIEPALPQSEQTCLMCCAVPVSDITIDMP